MKRIPRLLVIAFALSLLVHLIVALIMRPPTPTPQGQAEVVSLEHRPATITVRKIQTPPPPPPKRTPAPRTVNSAPPRKPNGLEGPAGTANGTPPAPTPAPATPPPTPAATSGAGCTQPNAGAAIAASPPPPDIAPGARSEGTSGVALVRVQLDPSGQVTRTAVVQSTGNSSLDLVAVGMARDARYTPALHECKPVAGDYAFSVKFVAW
ncbi:MAG TPA: TonB family protein [Candidatus Binatia bacterium]|nr:TonB family protein [Candidatus Binatia bacterium]